MLFAQFRLFWVQMGTNGHLAQWTKFVKRKESYLSTVLKRSQFKQAWIFQKPQLRACYWWNNFGRSSFQTRVIAALVSPFILSNNVLYFRPTERINWISRCRTLRRIFWKKLFEKLKYSISSPDPKTSVTLVLTDEPMSALFSWS